MPGWFLTELEPKEVSRAERRRFRSWGLLDFCQNFLLIVDDRIESALILQYGRLVLLDRFLICLDCILVRENGLLIL